MATVPFNELASERFVPVFAPPNERRNAILNCGEMTRCRNAN
jgi:hypothetical protein